MEKPQSAGFDGLVGRNLGLQRTLRSIESRKGWHSPRRWPVFAGAFVNVRDNLLITTFIFICKTCLEDNLIIYYKHFLYLLSLSLSLPVGAALIKGEGRGIRPRRDGHREPPGKEKTEQSFSPRRVLIGI